MSISKNILRLITIQRILVGYRLDELLDKVTVLKSFKYFFILLPRKISKNSSLGERIRRALEELGPIFVKFGQVVSTRRDLLPEEIADELAKRDGLHTFRIIIRIEMHKFNSQISC